MSIEITTAFVEQYSANIQLLSQQFGSRFRGAVDSEPVVGKSAFFDQVGATTALLRTTRHSDTPRVDTPHARRRVTLADYDWADLIDNEDRVRMLSDPTSPYAAAANAAMNRAMDDIIIAATTGVAYTGVAGATATTLPTTYDVGIAADTTGLTVAKLIKAKKGLDSQEVDESIPRFMSVGSQQLSDLLKTTEVTSSDYNSIKALVSGQVNTFMGFNFIRSERLPITTGVRLCSAWALDGVKLGIGADITVRITERADKNYAVQVFFSMVLGATRMEESKVLRVYSLEA